MSFRNAALADPNISARQLCVPLTTPWVRSSLVGAFLAHWSVIEAAAVATVNSIVHPSFPAWPFLFERSITPHVTAMMISIAARSASEENFPPDVAPSHTVIQLNVKETL